MGWVRLFVLFGHSFLDLFRSRASLEAERLVLRQQLAILKQQQTKRVRLQPVDRSFWALISKLWSRWQDALVIAEPDTVLRWRREGFRLIWRRRRRRAGRPSLAKAHQELIRWISTNSILWGAPRIHGEVRKLGINVSRTTVAKYMGPRATRASQSWRTFLRNHARELVQKSQLNDQSDDFQGRCFWLVPTAAKILASDLSVPPFAKSGQTTKLIEGAEPMVPFPRRAAMREQPLFESRAPPTRRTNTTKSEVREQRRPVARGTGRGSRSAPSFFRCSQIPRGRLAVVECSHGAPDGSEKLVA
jgi:hypothetical protein